MVYGYIYIITNKINGKMYVGQTVQGFDKCYHNNLLANTHNQHLKNALIKYGFNNFIIKSNFDIAYSKEELDSLEDMYIKLYETTNPSFGYNKRYGGARGKNSEETLSKMSEAHKKENIGEEKYNKQLECLQLGRGYGENNSAYGTGMIYIAINVKTNETHEFYSRCDAVDFVKGNKSEVYKASRGLQHKSKKYPDGNYYKGYLWYTKER